MRSRTECVTTTYHDESTDEDGNDSDESDDWRPSESKKKATSTKRKAPVKKTMKKTNKKKKNSSEDEISEISEDDYSDDNDDYAPVSSAKKTVTVKKFETYSDNQIFDLYINIKDINEAYKENNKISLWKKDGNSLLQKFIRVKTPNKDEFIFTTSTVYATWHDEFKDELKTIGVKFVPENKKRVIIANPDDLKTLLEAKNEQTDDTNEDDGDTSNDENE